MNPHALDLDPDSRQALEFDALLRVVAEQAATAPGTDRVLALAPVHHPQRVREEHERVHEVREILAAEARLVSGGLPDPRPALAPLAVEGVALDPRQLRDLAAVARAASDLRRRLVVGDEASPSRLGELARRLPDLAAEARRVLGSVEPDGRLADEASAELARLRRGPGPCRRAPEPAPAPADAAAPG